MWQQVLDYEGVPFRFRKCHEVGHLFKDCPKMGFTVPPQKKSHTVATQTDHIPCQCHLLAGKNGAEPDRPTNSSREPTQPLPTWPITQARTHAPSALLPQHQSMVLGTSPIPDSLIFILSSMSSSMLSPFLSTATHHSVYNLPYLNYTIALAPPYITPTIPHTSADQSLSQPPLNSDSSTSRHSYFL